MGCKASKDANVRNSETAKQTSRVVTTSAAERATVKDFSTAPTLTSPSRSAAVPRTADPPAPSPLIPTHYDAAAPLVEVVEVVEPEAANSPTSPICCPALAARRRSRSLSTASEPDIFSICESSTIESMSRRWNRRRFVEEGRQEMASMIVNGAVFEAMIARRCELEEEESSHATTTSPASTTMRSAGGTGCCAGTDSVEAAVDAVGCGPVALITPRSPAPKPAADGNRHTSDTAEGIHSKYSPVPTLLSTNSAAASPFSSRAVNTATSPTPTASTQKQPSLFSSVMEESENIDERLLESEEAKAACSAEPAGFMEASFSRSSSTTNIQVHEASLVVRQQRARPLPGAAEGSPNRGPGARSKLDVVVTPAKQMRRADPNIVSVAQGALKRSAMHQTNSATTSSSNPSSRSTSVTSYASRASAGTKARCNPRPVEAIRVGAARRGSVTSKRDRGYAALMQQEKYEQMCVLFERTLTQPSTLDAQLNTR